MSDSAHVGATDAGLPPRVAVVGGGLAGISAALACADAGAQVTLFEKRARLGGLTWSFTHDDLVMDNGQHVFLRCCTSYLDFLDRIGSAGDVELQERLDVTVLQGQAETAEPQGGRVKIGTLRRDPLPAPLHLGRSLLGYKLLPVGARLRLGPAALALSRLDLDDPALDEQTFATWLAEHGQGEAAISALWDLICLPTVNLPATSASLSMAAKVFQTGLLTEASAADIGWSRVPLGLLHGERGASALRKAGVEVRLGETVNAIDLTGPLASPRRPQEDGTRPGHQFEVQTTKGKMGAHGVVVALPHYCTEEVLPAGALPEQVRPSKLGSSPIVNVHIHFDRRVTDLPFLAGLGTEAQWIFDRTASAGATTGQYLAVSISAADHCIGARPEDLGPEVVNSLRALLPAARPARVLRTLVTREHNATFRATPGSAVHRAATRTRVPGLVLAGAWTATGWPPTMEGAVRSGVGAARAVLVSVGQRDGLPPLPREVNGTAHGGPRGERQFGGKTRPDGHLAPKIGAEAADTPVGQEAATSFLSQLKKLEEVV
jgi:squalene-associated FAD-dependent desaturase